MLSSTDDANAFFLNSGLQRVTASQVLACLGWERSVMPCVFFEYAFQDWQ